MIFELIEDFRATIEAMPKEHPRLGVLKLLEEAARRDLHFIDRHPTSLFQCLWNYCWWYDSPASVGYYEVSARAASESGASGQRRETLSALMEEWKRSRDNAFPEFRWVRSSVPPPLHLGAGVRACFRGHSAATTCVAVSADGRRVVSGSNDATVRLWDFRTGASLLTLREHDEGVKSVTISADGSRLAFLCADGAAFLWEENGDRGSARPLQPPTDLRAERVLLSRDGATLLLWGVSSVAVIDVDTGVTLRTLGNPRAFGSSTCVIVAPDELTVIVGGDQDDPIELEGGTEFLSFEDGWSSPSNRDTIDGDPVSEQETSLQDDDYKIAGYDIVVDSPIFGDDPRETQVIDPISGDVVSRWVWVSSDGDAAACPNRSRAIVQLGGDALLADEQGNEIRKLTGHRKQISQVGCSDDGRLVLTLSIDSVKVWTSESGQLVKSISSSASLIRCACLAPDGLSLVSGTHSGEVLVWDVEGSETYKPLRGHYYFPNKLAFSRDGTALASVSGGRRLLLWDGADGRFIEEIGTHAPGVEQISFSADGQDIWSIGKDGSAKCWSLRSKSVVESYPASGHAAALSADGSMLYYATAGEVRLLYLDSRIELVLDVAPRTSAQRIVFSEDSRLVASAFSGGDVVVWNCRSDERFEFRVDGSGLESMLAISPGGDKLACVAADESHGCVWELRSGSKPIRLASAKASGSVWNSIAKLAFTADGRYLIGSRMGQAPLVWEVATGARAYGNWSAKEAVAYSQRGAWRFIPFGDESAIQDVSSDLDVAWMPGSFTEVTPHPNGRAWAYIDAYLHVRLVRLEGVIDVARSVPD